MKKIDIKVKIAAVGRYNDEIEELKEQGVDYVFNLYAEAGTGFAEHTFQNLEDQNQEN